MDYMNGTERAELQAEQQAERDARDAARMRHEARRHTYAVLYLGRAWRVEANLDAEYGAEWTLNEASLLADENATLTAQLTHYDSMRTRHTLLQIANDDLRGECASLKRELEAVREERDTLAAKLDAANAKLAALENAALVAESATASADLVVNGDQSAPAPADAPEDDAPEPLKMWPEDVKKAILSALLLADEPLNIPKMRATDWLSMVPQNKLDAHLKEMSLTWKLIRNTPDAPEGTYELTPAGADSARAMLADADDDMPATLGDRRQQETRSIEWTPPTRSKPDAAA